jgi:drug/metabolite transporter (DMT)-like permease
VTLDHPARRRVADRDRLVGSAWGIGAAVSFGVVVVVQRSLAKEHLPVATVVGGRYAIAAVVLVAIQLALGRSPVPASGERLRAGLLGVFGYVVHSSLFYLALGHGSAAAVAMVFYLYPGVIVVIEMVARLRPVGGRTLAAPVLSGAGVAAVVAAGERVTMTTTGLVLALAASVAVSIYLLSSSRLIRRSHPMATGAWVAGGVALSMGTGGTLLSGFRLPAPAVPQLLLAGVATASATAFVYAALLRLGAGPTAVFMALQALVALVLGAVTLHEPITAPQVFGGAALVTGAALASGGGDRERRHRDELVAALPPE